MQPYIYTSFANIPKSFSWNEEQIGENKEGPINALILEGEFQRAEAPNRNKRIYSEVLLDRETNKLRKFILERNGLPMSMDHPLPSDKNSQRDITMIQRIGMADTCALCINLEMQNKVVYGKSKVLLGDNGSGDKLAAMVRAGFKPGVSSRGMGGKPDYDPRGFMLVPESYNMVTYDYVSQPSTFNAVLEQQLNEEIEFLKNISMPQKKKFYEVLTDLSEKYR